MTSLKSNEKHELLQLLDQLKPYFPHNHVTGTVGKVQVGLRLSRVSRRLPRRLPEEKQGGVTAFMNSMRQVDPILDVDVYNIQVPVAEQKKGHATAFMKLMRQVVWQRFKRGVFLECCITDASQALAGSLVRQGLAHKENEQPHCDNYLLMLPDSKEKPFPKAEPSKEEPSQ